MNREHIKELLPILQAYVEGKEIEVRINGEWVALGGHSYFTNAPETYRIKSEPRVIYVNIYKSGGYGAHNTAEAASGAVSAAVAEYTVKFIEVIE